MKRFSQLSHFKGAFASMVMMTLIPLLTVLQRSENVSQQSMSSEASRISECRCDLNNERYVDTFFITAKPGLTWKVTFKPADPAVAFSEVSGGYKVAVSSTYKKAYELSIQSSEFETVILRGGNCGESLAEIKGPVSVCLNSSATYSVSGQDSYSFSLSGGGSINTFSANSINITWGASSGTYQITAQNLSKPCMPDLVYEVTTGSAFSSNLACRNQVNISLDGQCEKKVLLSDVLINQNTSGSSVALVLKSENGNVIPGNILNKDHLGKIIKAEATDGCGNNSCWGTIKLEDKSSPSVICTDTVIMECFKLQDNVVIINANDCSNFKTGQIGPDQKTNFSCDTQYLSRILRRYQAVDEHGNTSDVCNVTLLVRRFPLDSVKFPQNKINEFAYDCNALLQGTVAPSVAGFPTIHGINLDKSDYPDCNLIVAYRDKIVQLPGKTKISRTWEITEWHCNQAIVRKSEQLIEVNDKISPVISGCPPQLKVTTSAHSCTGSVRLSALSASTLSDNCSNSFTQSIIVNNTTKYPGDWIDLPLGTHQLIYIVSDEAGNTASCSTSIVIEDKTSPVAICKEYIVMSLSNGGGYITTHMIDNGSKDECALDSILIRRMDDPANRPFRDTIHVSCADVEKPFRVVLRAKDKSGNINECMSQVLVQDKSIPQLVVPADMTINCDEWIQNENPKRFGEAQAYDQCNFTFGESTQINLNNCKTGTIVRTFTVKDASNTITKTQTITVRNSALADLSVIKTPKDTILNGMCTVKNLHPDSLSRYGLQYGRPILPVNACYQLGITYNDEVFTGQGPQTSNCFKVIRTWRIINWCETPNSVRELKQIIGIENNIAPTISMPPSDSIFHAVNCDSGTFSFTASGIDDCTPASSLSWTWRVLNSNNQIVTSGESVGNPVTATGVIPSGQYTFLWLLRDGCGNVKEARRSFKVQYTKGVSFFVVDSLALSLSPNDSTNSACIKASTLVMSANHPCKIPVKYSFSPVNASQDTLCFDCRNLGNNRVTVYAHDAYGVVTSATSVINVQDNNKVRRCDNTTDCIIWPKDTTINACNNALSPAAINSQPIIKSDCNCNNFTLSHTDRTLSTGSSECNTIERTHFVTFRCNGIVATFSNIQKIIRRNAMPITLNCPANTVNAVSTANCMASVTLSGPVVLNGGCHTGLTTTYRIGNGATQSGSAFTSLFAVGNTLVTFFVTDQCGNTNSCSVTVSVSDGEAPVCDVKSAEVFLNQQGNVSITDAKIFDNGSRGACGDAVLSFSVNRTQFSCDDLGRPVPVEVTVSAQNGRSSRCSTNVIVRDTIKPVITVRNISKEITNLNQTITISASELITSANDNCFIADSAVSPFQFSCANTGQNTVNVTVRDSRGNITTRQAIVTIIDKVPPTCNVKDVTIYVNANGTATINDASIFNAGPSMGCSGSVASYSVNRTTFNCSDTGRANPVLVTLQDNLGNTMACNANVFVVDSIKPVLTLRNITREITSATQSVTVQPSDFIVSASDNCGIADSIISQSVFTCSNIGQNTVTVSVRDRKGNISSAQAILTLVSRVPPVCNVRDVTLTLNSNGLASITNASVFNNGSQSGCGNSNLSYTVSRTNFTCADLGRANAVTVTVSDASGNTSTCAANVFVRDTIAPVTTPKNIQISITQPGQSVVINKVSVIQNISENCGISDTILSKSTFTCEDIGDNRITIQVIDISGNRDTVEATVTVSDKQAPVCRTRNVSIILNSQGQATIGDASVFNSGSFDECGSLPLQFSVNKTQFSCADLGTANPVIVTTTDAAGNSSTCSANVTVTDTIRPVISVRNISKTITNINTPVTVRASELIVSASDNCSVTDSANAPSVFTCSNIGANTVRVIARDASGNIGSAEAIVTIIDGIAPVCSLKSATVMVNGGTTTIDSSFINNGSFDPCGSIRTFKVSPNTFTCQDIGVKRVTATITDFAGNVSICDTTITVVDGNQLICVPKDITISLDANNSATITASDVDGGSGTGCGNPVSMSINKTVFGCADVGNAQNVILTVSRPGTQQSSQCTARVTVVSNSVPTLVCPAEQSTVSCEEYDGINIPARIPRPFVSGTCSNNFKLDSTIIRLKKGCDLDTLTRTYLLFDLQDNLLSTCVQSVYIINDKPLTLDSFNLPPRNFTLNSCADKSPDFTGGRMTLKTGVDIGCSDLSITFRDTFFLNTCNDTLRRIWTATDKCGSFSPLVFTQLIVIRDTVAPVISGVKDTIVYNQGDCGVFMDFTNITVNDCDTRIVVSNNSPHSNSRAVINPSGFYPVGNYAILLSAIDACGNSSQAGFTVQVRDTLSTGFFCRSVTKSIGIEGVVDVTARELVGFGGERCTSSGNLRVVMSRGNQDTIRSKTYSCNDLTLINGQLQKADTFTIRVYDGGTLLHTCNAFLRISGGQNCQNFFFVNNRVKTINEEVVPQFNVGLWVDGKELIIKQTNEEGLAKMSVPAGQEILIVPSKNDDYLNGVNTLDLVQIQRHILGINKFKSPYQMLAADVNNDKKISVGDIVEIRNLILGIKDKFESHTSWIAMDSKHQFISVSGALEEEYPQMYLINHLQNDMVVDFTGVKIGDVDISYTSKLNKQQLNSRKNQIFELEDRLVAKDEEFELKIKLDDVVGSDLKFNLNNLKVISYTGANWFVASKENVLRAINYDGRLSGELQIRLKAEKSGRVSELLQLDVAEAYDESLSSQPVSLRWNHAKADQTFLPQIKAYPNPSSTDVHLELQADGLSDAEIIINDPTGKIIYKTNKTLERGMNKLILTKETFESPGIYYIRINNGGFVHFTKLIITE